MPFWIEDKSGYVSSLGVMANTDKTAAAMKNYPDWTSILLTVPDSLPPELINNVASHAGAFVACEPGRPLVLSNRQLVLYGTENRTVEVRLPSSSEQFKEIYPNKASSEILDSDHGKNVRIETRPGEVKWLTWTQ